MLSGPKTRVIPTSLGGELLLAWMTRKRVSQRAMARYLSWSTTRTYRILSGLAELGVAEAFQIEDLTNGEVPARMWTYKATGADLQGAYAHARPAVGTAR